jgi:hypothetical protein
MKKLALTKMVNSNEIIYGLNRWAMLTLKFGEMVEQLVRSLPKKLPENVILTISIEPDNDKTLKLQDSQNLSK